MTERQVHAMGAPAAPSRPRSPAHARFLAISVAGAALLLAFGRFLEPDARGYGTHEQLGLPACRAMSVLGIPCPVCGVTTAAVLAARGRWLDSLLTQPLGFALTVAIFALAVGSIAAHGAGKDLGALAAALARRRGRVTAVIAAFGLAAWLFKLWRVCL